MSAEERIDELFAQPAEEFIAAREALAHELRGAGERERAAAVKKLRKPTVPAWALNQLARRDPDGLRELREAGEELARAQRRAMSGLDRTGLRTAQQRRRDITNRLLAEALDLLRAAGVPADPHADAVRGGLDAAALDAETGAAVAEGHLSRPPQAPSGFEGLTALTAVPSEEPDQASVVPAAQVPASEDPASEVPASEDPVAETGDEHRLAAAREGHEAAQAVARSRRAEADEAAAAARDAAEAVRRLERELQEARGRAATAEERARSAAQRAEEADATLAARQEALADAEAGATRRP